jgi:hypothetical protein
MAAAAGSWIEPLAARAGVAAGALLVGVVLVAAASGARRQVPIDVGALWLVGFGVAAAFAPGSVLGLVRAAVVVGILGATSYGIARLVFGVGLSRPAAAAWGVLPIALLAVLPVAAAPWLNAGAASWMPSALVSVSPLTSVPALAGGIDVLKLEPLYALCTYSQAGAYSIPSLGRAAGRAAGVGALLVAAAAAVRAAAGRFSAEA